MVGKSPGFANNGLITNLLVTSFVSNILDGFQWMVDFKGMDLDTTLLDVTNKWCIQCMTNQNAGQHPGTIHHQRHSTDAKLCLYGSLIFNWYYQSMLLVMNVYLFWVGSCLRLSIHPAWNLVMKLLCEIHMLVLVNVHSWGVQLNHPLTCMGGWAPVQIQVQIMTPMYIRMYIYQHINIVVEDGQPPLHFKGYLQLRSLEKKYHVIMCTA